MTEKEKMVSGELYDASDKELVQARTDARLLFEQYNRSSIVDVDFRKELLAKLIPGHGPGLYIEPPFHCDYGWNIKMGEKVYFNFGCTILDVTTVAIGDRTLFGPSVLITPATHPINWKQRSSGLESGKPIKIGSDVWIGAAAVICPGVIIGNRTIIGAGSVVTKDIPSDVVAVGNPCKVIRELDPKEL